jgi:hypothetical protein
MKILQTFSQAYAWAKEQAKSIRGAIDDEYDALSVPLSQDEQEILALTYPLSMALKKTASTVVWVFHANQRECIEARIKLRRTTQTVTTNDVTATKEDIDKLRYRARTIFPLISTIYVFLTDSDENIRLSKEIQQYVESIEWMDINGLGEGISRFSIPWGKNFIDISPNRIIKAIGKDDNGFLSIKESEADESKWEKKIRMKLLWALWELDKWSDWSVGTKWHYWTRSRIRFTRKK